MNLEKFIIKAKLNGWVGVSPGGKKVNSSRLGSFDITFEEGEFFYQDSFVGLTDFCGQEHICYKGEPIWSQCYFGKVLRGDLIDGVKTVEVLKQALGHLYQQGRFLGAFEYHHGTYVYIDKNNGDWSSFSGTEEIITKNETAYRLRYFGGTVRK